MNMDEYDIDITDKDQDLTTTFKKNNKLDAYYWPI